jgi:hypothetical protein
VVQSAIHEKPAAVVHKHHNDRTFFEGGLIMLFAQNFDPITNVIFTVTMRFGAHKLAVSRQVKVM